MANTAGNRTVFQLNQRLCKGCGICIELCPKAVLKADHNGKPVMEDAENCIHCDLCEMRCPDFAIRFVGVVE